MRAQRARGADFGSGGPIRRAKALVPVLTPLFVLSFRRADELALAMEARCYRAGHRAHPAAPAEGRRRRRRAPGGHRRRHRRRAARVGCPAWTEQS